MGRSTHVYTHKKRRELPEFSRRRTLGERTAAHRTDRLRSNEVPRDAAPPSA